MLRACIVQGSQQIWVAALWYWGFQLQDAKDDNLAPWWIVLIVWPLAVISFLFSYLMLYGLPGKQFLARIVIILSSHLDTEYYRQTPPKVPSFVKTLFRRKLVLWFLASEILRDYWLSGVSLGCRYLGSSNILIPYIALRSQLGLLMGCANSQMADCAVDRHLLCGHLGCDVICAHSLQQDAHVVTPCIRRWPWRT